MKIGVDISALATDNWTGVARIVHDQLLELIKIGNTHTWNLFGLCPRKKTADLARIDLFKFENSQKKIYPIPAKIWQTSLSAWQALGTPPVEIFTGRLDAFFSPCWFYLPSRAKIRCSYLFDLYAFTSVEADQNANLQLERKRLNKLNKNANLLFSISKSTAKAAHQFLNIDQGKIIITYPGTKLYKAKKTRGSDKYFVFAGSFDERKNLENLIKALHYSNAKDTKLYLIGDGNRKALHNLAKKYSLLPRIVFLPWQAHEKMGQYYSQSLALVFPSLQEGFGLPIAEAYANKTLVVTSNISAMPEVASKAGILVNPHDPQSIGKALDEVSKMSKKERTRRIELGQKHIKKFSYQKSANIILKALNTENNK